MIESILFNTDRESPNLCWSFAVSSLDKELKTVSCPAYVCPSVSRIQTCHYFDPFYVLLLHAAKSLKQCFYSLSLSFSSLFRMLYEHGRRLTNDYSKINSDKPKGVLINQFVSTMPTLTLQQTKLNLISYRKPRLIMPVLLLVLHKLITLLRNVES